MSMSAEISVPGKNEKYAPKPYINNGKPTDKPIDPNDVRAMLKPSSGTNLPDCEREVISGCTYSPAVRSRFRSTTEMSASAAPSSLALTTNTLLLLLSLLLMLL